MINFEKIFLFFKKCSRQLIGNMKTLESVQKKNCVSKKSNKMLILAYTRTEFFYHCLHFKSFKFIHKSIKK